MSISALVFLHCFFRMTFVVTSFAKAHQIVIIIRKFWIFIRVLDVMHCDRRRCFTVSPAHLALIPISSEYLCTLALPLS